jgi:hypothetical protein
MKKLAIACAMLMTLVTASIACDEGEGSGCAVVLKASDGFWNMRTRPNGPVVTRLYRGDEVDVCALPTVGALSPSDASKVG